MKGAGPIKKNEIPDNRRPPIIRYLGPCKNCYNEFFISQIRVLLICKGLHVLNKKEHN